jgi:hypothetical protein
MPNIKHALFALGSIAACTSSPQSPQNDGPPPPAIPLQTAQREAYTVAVNVGGQTLHALVDSGSSTLAFAGATCTDCPSLAQVYTPGATATDLGSEIEAAYGVGDWMGELYRDTVGLAGDTSSFPMKLGYIESQDDFLTSGSDAEGIIGFNPFVEVQGTDTYISDRIAAGDTGVFAIQMCPYDGTLWFGGADKTHEVSDEQYTALAPISDQQWLYEIALQSATIGGTSINLSGAAVPDTGTTIMVLPTAAANALAAAVTADAGFQSIFPGEKLGLSDADNLACSLSTSKTAAEIDAALPKFEVTLNDLDGNPFTLSATATSSYLRGFGDYYCSFVGSVDDAPAIILGDAFLNSFISVFDPVNSKIGFAPQQGCTVPDDAKVPAVPRVPFIHGHPGARA